MSDEENVVQGSAGHKGKGTLNHQRAKEPRDHGAAVCIYPALPGSYQTIRNGDQNDDKQSLDQAEWAKGPDGVDATAGSGGSDHYRCPGTAQQTVPRRPLAQQKLLRSEHKGCDRKSCMPDDKGPGGQERLSGCGYHCS